MTDESMLERVAKAISCDGFVDDGDRRAARAAVEAMREPTEAMCKAGAHSMDRDYGDDSITADEMWSAMIDAILREGEST
jgi:hypothetical protein